MALIAVAILPAYAQRMVWTLPSLNETVQVNSFGLGSMTARDTYLSQSTYSGFLIGLERDNWTNNHEERLFGYGRRYSTFNLGALSNPLGGGSTLSLAGQAYKASLWHAVECSMCDLLVGPAGLLEVGALFNMQNSNNPINAFGHIALGFCADNTFRFRVFKSNWALQATLFAQLAGVAFAPDYDQPYYYMLRYLELEKALHFVTPFNYTAFTQQIALIVPAGVNRIRLGMTLDAISNGLGGHTHTMVENYFTIGFVRRFDNRGWERMRIL